MKQQKGFTLIEILMALGILAIIAAVGVVTYSGYRDRVNIDGEGTRAVYYLREAIARARSQQTVDNSTSTIWAIHIDNTDQQDYYEILSGGIGGVSVDKVNLSYGITFTATTSDATVVLEGGPTLTPLSGAINFGLIVPNTTIREEISVSTNGKISRTKYY